MKFKKVLMHKHFNCQIINILKPAQNKKQSLEEAGTSRSRAFILVEPARDNDNDKQQLFFKTTFIIGLRQ